MCVCLSVPNVYVSVPHVYLIHMCVCPNAFLVILQLLYLPPPEGRGKGCRRQLQPILAYFQPSFNKYFLAKKRALFKLKQNQYVSKKRRPLKTCNFSRMCPSYFFFDSFLTRKLENWQDCFVLFLLKMSPFFCQTKFGKGLQRVCSKPTSSKVNDTALSSNTFLKNWIIRIAIILAYHFKNAVVNIIT